MYKPKCPTCGREAKLHECICRQSGRKRIMVEFTCDHWWSHPHAIVYNVPIGMDDNTIWKEYASYFEEWIKESEVQFVFPTYSDIYLD